MSAKVGSEFDVKREVLGQILSREVVALYLCCITFINTYQRYYRMK